jgi:outer membrane autotransporter protein
MMFKLAWMRRTVIFAILFCGMVTGAPVQVPNDTYVPENQLAAWIKLGTQNYGYYDLDGKVTDSQTVTVLGDKTLFYGMANSDVAKLGGGSVKAIAAKYYHDYTNPTENFGLADNGSSLGMMAQSVKPFTVTSNTLANGTVTSCSINTVYDGFMVLQEKQASEYSSGQIDYMIEIRDGTGDDATALTTGDGDAFSYSGQLRIQDALAANGTTHTYTIDLPNTCVDVDYPDEAEENYWDEDNDGYADLTIARIDDPTTPGTYTLLTGSLPGGIPANIQAAITGNATYKAAGNKIFYIVFNKTTTFNATVGQTYWVSMDMQSAAQTSKSDNGIAGSYDGDNTVAVCDFSNTVLYAMTVAGAEVRTMVEIADDEVFGAGNVEVDGAVLSWSDDADLDNSLELLNGNEVTVNTNANNGSVGAITGTGDLLKTGTGTLTLDTACTFAGDTTVEEGKLVINNAYASDVDITGGTLGGSGTLAGALSLTSGSLAPGNSIGTITVADFTMNGGTLKVEIDDAGNADKVVATNSTTLTSGSVELIPTEVITSAQSYTIIQSTNNIVGSASNLTKIDNSYLLDFDLSISGSKNLIMTTTMANDFSDASGASGSSNTAGVAGALQTAANNGQGGTPMMQMQQMTEGQLNQTMEQLQPQAYQGASQVLGQQTSAVNTSTLGRINTVGFAARQANKSWDYALADASDGLMGEAIRASSAMPDMRKGKWVGFMRSLNDWGKVNGDKNAKGYRWQTHGMDVGMETFATDNVMVGASIAALWSNVHGVENSGASEVTSLYGNLYASKFTDEYHLDMGFSYGHAWTETQRPIPALGLKAKGDYESDIYSGFIGGGLFYKWRGYEIEPFIVYTYTARSDGGCKEKDADTMNLNIHRNNTDSLRHQLGVRVSKIMKLRDGSTLRPFVSAAWDYEYLSDNIVGSADLLGSTFHNSSVTIDRSSGVFSAGMDWYFKPNISLFADYTLTTNSDMMQHSVNGGIRIVF